MSEGHFAYQDYYSRHLLCELPKHANAEESLVYPAFEQYLGAEGKVMADKDRLEHQNVKRLMYQIAATPVTHPQHAYLLSLLMRDLNEHIRGEEDHDLPKLESAMTLYNSALLGQAFQQMKLRVAV